MSLWKDFDALAAAAAAAAALPCTGLVGKSIAVQREGGGDERCQSPRVVWQERSCRRAEGHTSLPDPSDRNRTHELNTILLSRT